MKCRINENLTASKQFHFPETQEISYQAHLPCLVVIFQQQADLRSGRSFQIDAFLVNTPNVFERISHVLR
jgi:hypothetical protein